MLLFTVLLICGCSDSQEHFLQVPDSEYKAYWRQLKNIRARYWAAVPRGAFEQFVTGYCNMVAQGLIKAGSRAVLIDYTRPSTEPRLYVLDVAGRRVLINSLVAHGRNSGKNRATRFSNKIGSKMSSLGFFLTAETYQGKHGYSLRLEGVEKGINHHARLRAIVIHGAHYVSSDFARENGRLGRSWGCPALPTTVSKEIIDMVKDGCCLYIHGSQKIDGDGTGLRKISPHTLEVFNRVFQNNQK